MSLPPLPKKTKEKKKKKRVVPSISPCSLPYVSLYFFSQVCLKLSTKANRSYDERLVHTWLLHKRCVIYKQNICTNMPFVWCMCLLTQNVPSNKHWKWEFLGFKRLKGDVFLIFLGEHMAPKKKTLKSTLKQNNAWSSKQTHQKTMHGLRSKPTQNTHVVDLSKKQTIGKEVVEHTHTHTHTSLGERLPTTQKLSWKWVSHTCIHTHTHTHTHSHTQLLLQSITFIYSFFKHNGIIITCIRHGINCAIEI
jgi:hypothetical protein